MKRFIYYQPNNKDIKDNYGDCVIRALTRVLNKEWVEVYDDLVPYGREMQCMPNDKQCLERYLADNGFEYEGVSNRKGTKRPTIDSFAREHKEGVYVVRVAHHITAIVDGMYYDTWDSGDNSMYGYWYKIK